MGRVLLEETTRKGARPDDVAIATVHLKELPAADAVPVLRRLLEREDPYIRLEAAITLRAFLPEDDAAKEAVVTLALDRSIACEWRLDLTNRWSRKRALDVALEWGGLTPADLRAHFLAPEPEDPVLLKAATARLANTPEALTNEEIRPVWRRLLDSPMADRVVAAVRFLVDAGDAASRERMLAALDRLDARIAAAGPDAVGVRANTVADLRAQVQELED